MAHRIVKKVRERPLLAALFLALAGAVSFGVMAHSCVSQPPEEPAPSIGPTEPAGTVRVLLTGAGAPLPLEIRVGGLAHLRWRKAGNHGDLPVRGAVKFVPAEGGVVVFGTLRVETARLSGAEGAVFHVGSRRYAGDILVGKTPGKDLKVVNEVPLETYLEGVIGGEMPPSWDMEALKAQAVAARTYAVSRKNDASFRGRDFDLYDDTRSQVYIGIPSGKHAGRIETAVRATSGEVLVYGGKLLNAYFHSTCGGHTESALSVFETDGVPPLRGVACVYCGDSSAFRWEAEVPRKDLEAFLGVGALKSLGGMEPGPSGRARRVFAKGSGGEAVLPSDTFRRKIGTTVLKSTAFEAEIGDETVRFKGRGYGHGVGLCQWGARGMAGAGKDYIDILRHYYPEAMMLQVAVLGPVR